MNNIIIYGVGSVNKAYQLNTGTITGIFCEVTTQYFDRHWVILSGARLADVPNESLCDNYNYRLAYDNYKKAQQLCKSGYLCKHFTLTPKGSESQCLTILLGTPSSRKHACRHLAKLNDTELKLHFAEKSHPVAHDTDEWISDEKIEYERSIKEDQSSGPGIVYLVASNDEQYRYLVKIGMTRKTLKQGIGESTKERADLFSEYKELFHIEVPNPQTIEKGLHYLFATSRKTIIFSDGATDEWFEIDWQQAKRIMQIISEKDSLI